MKKTLKIEIIILLISFIIDSSNSHSQLDSISLSANFTSEVSSYDSSVFIGDLTIGIWFNDTSDIGFIEVFVLDYLNNSPISYQSFDSIAIYGNGIIDSLGIITISGIEIDPNQSYKIKVIARNSQLYFLPEETLEIGGI